VAVPAEAEAYGWVARGELARWAVLSRPRQPMKDIWYSDNRDLVKWGVLLKLAELHGADTILQVAYYRSNTWPKIEIDGVSYSLPGAILEHFRRVGNAGALRSNAKILVVDLPWQDRAAYLEHVLRCIRDLPERPSIVFLDPDIGLEPKGGAGLEHVSETELRTIWQALRPGDVLVFYQHRTNRNSRPWIEPKKAQFERSLGLESGRGKVAHGQAIAHDVVLFFTQKGDSA